MLPTVSITPLGVAGGRQQIARIVDRVQRLDQGADALAAERVRRIGEVPNIGVFVSARVGAIGHDSGQHMNLAAIQSIGIAERIVDRTAEVVLPARQRGDAPLSRLPIPRREVEERLAQPVVAEPGRDLRLAARDRRETEIRPP